MAENRLSQGNFKPMPPPRKEDKLRGALDADNKPLMLSPKKDSPMSRTRIKRSTKVPDVKTFHGQLRSTRSGPPEGAIYDFEDESAEPAYDPMKLSAEELMQQPDFLKIDQSKLPLEIFDSTDYELLDKSPSEWLESGRDGFAPYYISGQWIWKEAEVLGYNSETGKYIIRFGADGKPKEVHRLNLRMGKESPIHFEERRTEAEKGRTEAKQIMRFDHFVNVQVKVAHCDFHL